MAIGQAPSPIPNPNDEESIKRDLLVRVSSMSADQKYDLLKKMRVDLTVISMSSQAFKKMKTEIDTLVELIYGKD